MKSVVSATDVFTQGKNIGSAKLEHDFGFDGGVLSSNMRKIIRDVRATLKKLKKLEPHLLSIVDWVRGLVCGWKSCAEQTLCLLEVVHHVLGKA